MTPAKRPTPQDLPRAADEDLEAPASTVRPALPLFAVPWLAIRAEGLRLLPLDARAAYLLSLVDGDCTVETIPDMSEAEVGRAKALDALAFLLELGAIELRDPR